MHCKYKPINWYNYSGVRVVPSLNELHVTLFEAYAIRNNRFAAFNSPVCKFDVSIAGHLHKH